MTELETVPLRQCNGTTIAGGRVTHTDICPLHGPMTAWDILGIDPDWKSGRDSVNTLIDAAREEGRRAGWAEAIAALKAAHQDRPEMTERSTRGLDRWLREEVAYEFAAGYLAERDLLRSQPAAITSPGVRARSCPTCRSIGTPRDDYAWRVQWISRANIDAPEDDAGRRDFLDEIAAQTYWASDEVQSRVSTYWRAELRRRPPDPGWETIANTGYAITTEAEEAAPDDQEREDDEDCGPVPCPKDSTDPADLEHHPVLEQVLAEACAERDDAQAAIRRAQKAIRDGAVTAGAVALALVGVGDPEQPSTRKETPGATRTTAGAPCTKDPTVTAWLSEPSEPENSLTDLGSDAEIEQTRAALDWLFECHCDVDWTSRGRHDPSCCHQEYREEYDEVIAATRAEGVADGWRQAIAAVKDMRPASWVDPPFQRIVDAITDVSYAGGRLGQGHGRYFAIQALNAIVTNLAEQAPKEEA